VLARDLAPAFVLFGDEPLLIEESLDAIRAAATTAGFTESLTYTVEQNFNWDLLGAAGSSLSLFASRRLVVLRMPSVRPGEPGTAAIREYCARNDRDSLLVVVCGQLDAATRKTRWYLELANYGLAIEHRALDASRFREWLRQRLAGRGLRADRDVIEWLAYSLEGNLLAASQEVEKLALACPDGTLTMELVAEHVADHARFNVYALLQAGFTGDWARCARVLDRLRREGVEPVFVALILGREVQSLAMVSAAVAAGVSVDRALQQFRIWSQRQPAFRSALSRIDPDTARRLLQDLAALDRALKGRQTAGIWGNIWIMLERACASLCRTGLPVPMVRIQTEITR